MMIMDQIPTYNSSNSKISLRTQKFEIHKGKIQKNSYVGESWRTFVHGDGEADSVDWMKLFLGRRTFRKQGKMFRSYGPTGFTFKTSGQSFPIASQVHARINWDV